MTIFVAMDKLINYLLEFGQLNQQQIDLIKRKAQVLELKKGDYFSEAGKTPKQVAFIEEGILRVCYYNSEGDEITKYFVDENNFAVDINSFNQKIPSSEYVQAVTDCTLLVFSTGSLNDLSATIIQWDSIINKITEKALVEKVNKLSPMLAEDATTRYLSFLEKFPNLANRIPLSYLASYLGITQSSLSRIRKSI
ncbi:cAMP-binding domain of CRP or a regulatory subunit of cAMP-dependent protein kinases [Catalinimonas alkaloidigena]|uniref:cAMP-binding domain of CRP or a regulatory subunit of cAMP-dependent protein kinases n=2 Tax=Catalinimonas alkaloidigena TaxID=1075417 RepID=A0A1G9B4I4_9BACT|nr:cAMP-binding domain of CRP or a regulatory subunit of cAMP-dependent protein kinases [Catalinimonas alkaloidigena]